MAAGPSSSSLSAVSKYTSFMLMRVHCVGYFSSVKTEVSLCSSSMSSSSTLRLRIGASFDFVFDEALVAGTALGLVLEVTGIRFPFAASLADGWGFLAALEGIIILFLVEIALMDALPFRFGALDSFESTDDVTESESSSVSAMLSTVSTSSSSSSSLSSPDSDSSSFRV